MNRKLKKNARNLENFKVMQFSLNTTYLKNYKLPTFLFLSELDYKKRKNQVQEYWSQCRYLIQKI